MLEFYILELRKVPIFEFQYHYIKNKYSNKSRLLFKETDRWLYEIEAKNIYDDFSKNKKLLDFSHYSAKSKCYDNLNALVGGKMKDKTTGVAVEEFVGLKLKMYSVLSSDSKNCKKAKCVNKNVVAKVRE